MILAIIAKLYNFYWHIIRTTFKNLLRGKMYVIYVKTAIGNKDSDEKGYILKSYTDKCTW
jgi:hypothetical protein